MLWLLLWQMLQDKAAQVLPRRLAVFGGSCLEVFVDPPLNAADVRAYFLGRGHEVPDEPMTWQETLYAGTTPVPVYTGRKHFTVKFRHNDSITVPLGVTVRPRQCWHTWTPQSAVP